MRIYDKSLALKAKFFQWNIGVGNDLSMLIRRDDNDEIVSGQLVDTLGEREMFGRVYGRFDHSKSAKLSR